MSEFLNQLAFGWFPYLAITVLIVGSILRFDADQYSWRSQSSQFLRRRQSMIGLAAVFILVLVSALLDLFFRRKDGVSRRAVLRYYPHHLRHHHCHPSPLLSQ